MSGHIGPTTSGSRARLARGLCLTSLYRFSPHLQRPVSWEPLVRSLPYLDTSFVAPLCFDPQKKKRENRISFSSLWGGSQKMGSDSPNRPRPPGGQTTYITLPYSTLSGTCRHRLQRRFPCVGGLIGNVFRLHVLSMSVKIRKKK